MPDEILKLDRRQCIALFQGRKPALLYKLTPEELPDYGGLRSCRVADYVPEWAKNAGQVQRTEMPTQPSPEPKQEAEPKQEPPPEDESNPSKDLEYKLNKGLGMVELRADGVVGGDDEDEELPPGR